MKIIFRDYKVEDALEISNDLKFLFTSNNLRIIEHDDKIIGAYELANVYDGVELRFGLNRAYRGKGMGKSILGLTLNDVFMRNPELNKVKFFVSVGNEPAIRLIESLGIVSEAEMGYTSNEGYKTYEYNNSKAAKIEVLGSNLGKSSAIIEYKIVVTNEGAVAGYAKKIVDYLPKGVSFSTELNKDWYLSDNGNVYNASLANEIIKPGESKELTLVVTKKITEDSLGDPINNNAEIYESYNEQGLKDIDSTTGNKAQNEDDMSMADVIFSIVTGKIIMYTTITLGVIAILGFGVFEIKKRVLKKRKN